MERTVFIGLGNTSKLVLAYTGKELRRMAGFPEFPISGGGPVTENNRQSLLNAYLPSGIYGETPVRFV